MKIRRIGALLLAAVLMAGCGSGQQKSASEGTGQSQDQAQSSSEASIDVIPSSYAYAMTVTINPKVKLYFDKDDKINGIEYLNKDAIDAYKEVKLVGSTVDDGMTLLVDAAIEKKFLKESGTVNVELSEVADTSVVKDNTQLQNANKALTACLKDEKRADIKAVVETVIADEVTSKTGIKAVSTCKDCNGTGNDCKECGGTNIVKCKRCNNGYETCGICHGSGKEICHGCKGTGKDDHGGTCNRCGGAGAGSTCSGCGGKGGFNCSWCKGKLTHICPICEGNKKCKTCGGTGSV